MCDFLSITKQILVKEVTIKDVITIEGVIRDIMSVMSEDGELSLKDSIKIV